LVARLDWFTVVLCVKSVVIPLDDCGRRCCRLQMQENLDREKKVRADVEKVKRKLETDLKATQEAVEELDRIKKELEDNVRRSASALSLLTNNSAHLLVT